MNNFQIDLFKEQIIEFKKGKVFRPKGYKGRDSKGVFQYNNLSQHMKNYWDLFDQELKTYLEDKQNYESKTKEIV